MGVLTRPRGFALLIREAAWRGARYRALVPGPNIDGDLAPDVTASAPLPAPGTAARARSRSASTRGREPASGECHLGIPAARTDRAAST